MICVSIARGRHKHVMAEHRHLVEQGAQLVEIRLDYIRRQINLKRLLRDRLCPVIATCRRVEDQGKWEGSEESRLMVLRSAIADEVEYVDLESDIADSIPRYGKTKRIVSMHNFRETPENLEEIHERLSRQDADIVKMATMANDPHDNVRMLQLVKNSRIPTVGICMGEIGAPSRILAGKFGAPFTYATFHHERTLAPGQLSFKQMKEIYGYDHLKADTAVYAVVADPIGNNPSTVVHNAGFRSLEIHSVCVPFRVPREHLSGFLQDCRELDISGLMVAHPHRESIIPKLSKLDKAAERIHAVNTVAVRPPDTLLGYNTDYRAAVVGLIKASGVSSDDALHGKRALVLGAGSIARAIIHGLRHANVDVVIASRTLQRAQELAQDYECQAVGWDARYSVRTDMLINCTPIGMHPNVDDSPYSVGHIRRNWIVLDVVYNPEQTLLIKEARERGCRVVTGVDLFICKAALQFKLFTGQNPPGDEMRKALKRTTGAAKL
ncbi:MAG: type I 3-dehydroquinate dehydratase [Planctomycetota bacterium]